MENNQSYNRSLPLYHFTPKINASSEGVIAPPILTLWFETTILSLYVITLLIGFFGNCLICYIFLVKRKRLRGIHLLTINLACSDLIVLLLFLPAEMYQIDSERTWALGRVTCKIVYNLNSITVNASIGTLILITRDRYVAVTKPMSIHKRPLKLIKVSIFIIWVISILVTLPLFIVADTVNFLNVTYCTEKEWGEKGRVYWTFVFVFQFVVPMLYLTATYCVIIYRLHSNFIPNDCIHLSTYNRQVTNRAKTPNRLLQRKKQQSRMVKMSVILVIAYALCISPQHAVYFMLPDLPRKTAGYAFTLANYMMILNSAINPVIYGTLNNEIKKGIHRLLFLCRKQMLKSQTSTRERYFRTAVKYKPNKFLSTTKDVRSVDTSFTTIVSDNNKSHPTDGLLNINYVCL